MANGVHTVHIGPEQIVAELSVAFEPSVGAAEIERAVERIEAAIRADYPEIIMLYVKPQSHEAWRAWLARIEATSSPALRASGSRRRAAWRKPAHRKIS
jgi:hypothetical protein